MILYDQALLKQIIVYNIESLCFPFRYQLVLVTESKIIAAIIFYYIRCVFVIYFKTHENNKKRKEKHPHFLFSIAVNKPCF